MVVSRLTLASPTDEHTGRLSDEVELYQRTYNTLLRSSGETRLRVLESSHMAMGSSLHPLADSDEIDLGAFIYAIRRLPDSIVRIKIVVMGQEAALFRRAGIGPLEQWDAVEAAARRRRWYDSGDEVLAVLLASESDVDDLVPTLVAFQIEWNKIRRRMLAAGWPPDEGATPEGCAVALGGAADDWARLADAWGETFEERLQTIADESKSMRIRMLGGTQVGYQRMTRRWWAPVRAEMNSQALGDAPLYFASSNTHSLSNLVTGLAREREDELVAFVERRDLQLGYLRDDVHGRSDLLGVQAAPGLAQGVPVALEAVDADGHVQATAPGSLPASPARVRCRPHPNHLRGRCKTTNNWR